MLSRFQIDILLLSAAALSCLFTALIYFRLRQWNSVWMEALSEPSPLPNSMGVSLRIENRTSRTIFVESIAVGGNAYILTDDNGVLAGTGAGAVRLGSAVRSQFAAHRRRVPPGSQVIVIPLVVECPIDLLPALSVKLRINRRVRSNVTRRIRILK